MWDGKCQEQVLILKGYVYKATHRTYEHSEDMFVYIIVG